jgi:hypothetical protein
MGVFHLVERGGIVGVKVFRSWKGRLWAPLLVVACLAAFPAAAFAEVVDDDPAAASNGPGNVSIAMRDSSGNLVTRAWTGTQWSPWAALTGLTLTSGPSIDIRPGPHHGRLRAGARQRDLPSLFRPGQRLVGMGLDRGLRHLRARLFLAW